MSGLLGAAERGDLEVVQWLLSSVIQQCNKRIRMV
jgi:hypothetical protein